MKKRKSANKEINGEDKLYDINYGFSNDEINKLKNYLSDYNVNIPCEDEIDRTINVLKYYMPKKTKHSLKNFSSINEIFKLMLISLNYMSKIYFIFIGMIYIAGWFITKNNGISPYKTLFFLSPVPFFSGIINVVRGREENVMELEMACRISARQILFSKLLISGIYCILLNSLISIFFINSEPLVDPWKITILWFTPFTFISGIALFITKRVKGYYISYVLICIWLIIAYTICLSPYYMQKLASANNVLFILLMLTGLVFLIIQFKNFCFHLPYMQEGDDCIEA